MKRGTILLRHFLKNKVNTLLNIVGLTVSLTAFVLLANFVYKEITTDKFHSNRDRIYALSISDGSSLSTPAALGTALENSISGIEKISRCQLFIRNFVSVKKSDQTASFKSKIIFADSTFFDVFSFQGVEGNLRKALAQPNSVVLTQSEAKKIFGLEDPVGKTLWLGENGQLTVTAVIEDLPLNTAFDFAGVADMNSVRMVHPFTLNCGWKCRNVETFVLLNDSRDYASVQAEINKLVAPELKSNEITSIVLKPFKGLYFNTQTQTELRHGNISLVRILMLIGALIVVIALINYINLTMAQARQYLQSTGIKKMFGSSRVSLVQQFIAESIFLSFVAYIFAIILSNLLAPVFNPLLGITLSGMEFFSGGFWIGLAAIVLIVGPLSGLYPAYILTSTSPIALIKNEVNKGRLGLKFRKALIVFQFSVSIVLIICTLVISGQLNFVTTSNPGFTKDNLLIVGLSPKMAGKYESLRQNLLRIPEVKEVAYSFSYPGNMLDYWTTSVFESGEKKKVGFTAEMVEPHYLEMMGMTILKGRAFEKDRQSDNGTFVINETAAKEFGLKDPLNAKIAGNGPTPGAIIGVVKDFHFESMHNPIKPLVMLCGNDQFMNATIRYQAKNIKEVDSMIASIKQNMAVLDPTSSFEMKWFDETVEQMYQEDRSFMALINLFSGLAIFLACLGLFGLSLFETENKVKEIGIRKVNGAKIAEVIIFLNRDFVLRVLIGFLVAVPVGWYVMHNWLESFAYKTPLSWWIFALAGLLALGIALLTVSWQSWRAATRNPVEALRYE